ncbi:hypothetical protein XM38_013110 [Halomicronema hongdechloris C2206]|uniref:Uncharacterized protein n=1 Tax=Halomicronema hongdechloris C2206 TaxID=1641165 RepID=A0A1Z3HJB1_9CYAN|nr:hypothetical protein XM38_013110 [Halomicronema hongdechloris C2206]
MYYQFAHSSALFADRDGAVIDALSKENLDFSHHLSKISRKLNEEIDWP